MSVSESQFQACKALLLSSDVLFYWYLKDVNLFDQFKPHQMHKPIAESTVCMIYQCKDKHQVIHCMRITLNSLNPPLSHGTNHTTQRGDVFFDGIGRQGLILLIPQV